MESRREKIIKLLRESQKPLTVDDILHYLGLDYNERQMIYEDLKHIAKTIRRQSKGREALVMYPPYCRDCGYVFKDLDKPKKPSKCPKCKSQRIAPPSFKITYL